MSLPIDRIIQLILILVMELAKSIPDIQKAIQRLIDQGHVTEEEIIALQSMIKPPPQD
jgi:hypothetical protein